ncbi:hypothetical protein [Microbacterium sp. VKM Ac-2923]|uniref:hypothetical protein n=1 Tax=Microbacterium sp. VKM Ac-2923 TaxID=2929476 RepID=UPI001FB37FC3|nr:hypothetical protein [Microbacterium sp. VKM Ac-2923]MCJ1706761.1 hypothetical protein [Microbacterium sp. VKM Ac-2923]
MVILAVIVLTACTSTTPESAPSVAASASGPAVDAPPTTATPASETPDPTCENIIPQATADDFKSLGWVSQQEPFRLGGTALDEGIQCKWGDQRIASDRVQIFGWAPIDAATAATAQKELVASGWKVEVDDNGTYVTENPEWLGGRGVDGYGLTYLFGDGWVKLADTRQSLILVDAPR